MKKTLLIFLLIILPATLLKSQQLLKTFGNNHVSTTSIEFTADGRLILIGGYAKFYDVTSGMVDFRSIPKDRNLKSAQGKKPNTWIRQSGPNT